MNWNDLSMADRAKYIKLGLDNGITNLNTIRNAYNEFAKGGPIKNSKDYKKALSDYWHEDVNKHDYDYDKYYNDDPVEAQKQLNLILSGKGGHFPDAGKSGTYKKPTHPTYPDLGDESWSNNDTIFHLSDRQMDGDTDRVLDYLGADLDYNNGSTKAVYKGGFILPTITVTPKGNYTDLVPNKLNSGWVYKRSIHNKYDEGGPKENKVLSTGNSYADAALGFVPFVGSAMEIEDAVREPSLKNIGSAAFSVGTDLLGLSLLRGGVKAYRLAKAANKAAKEFKAVASKKDVSKAYKILQTPNLNPKKYEAASETLRNSGADKAFRKAIDADNARISYGLYEHPFINNSLNLAGFTGGLVQDATQFINSLDNNR